jgi:hypothetical protein
MSILKQKKFLLSVILLVGIFFSMPAVSHAAGLVPCGGPTEKPCTVTDIFVLIAKVTNWLIAMAGVYAVYKMINAGFWMIVSAGNEETITKEKGALSNAVVGFVLVLMSFMLINTVVNLLLTRSLVTTKDAACNLDLTSPLTYLTIKDTSKCSGVNDSSLHSNP